MTRSTLAALVAVVITRTLFDALYWSGITLPESHGNDAMSTVTVDHVTFYPGYVLLLIDGAAIRVSSAHVLMTVDHLEQ